MNKEFNLKDLQNDKFMYEKEVFSEVKQSVQEGEFQRGNVYYQQFPEDVADAIENLLFLQNESEVVVRVRKDLDGHHINFEVISRTKNL